MRPLVLLLLALPPPIEAAFDYNYRGDANLHAARLRARDSPCGGFANLRRDVSWTRGFAGNAGETPAVSIHSVAVGALAGVVLESSLVFDNVALVAGGGAYIAAGGDLAVVATTICGNGRRPCRKSRRNRTMTTLVKKLRGW